MESLARLVALIVLGRVLWVALCVALTISAIAHHFADGVLQTRGLPPSPLWWAGLAIAVAGLLLHLLTRR